MPVFVGTGAMRTPESVALAEGAKAMGADGLLLGTPLYSVPTERENALNALAIDRAADLPVILYNYPGRMGVSMGREFLDLVGQSRNIVGIKESSGDINRLHLLAHDYPQIQMSCGMDDQALEFFAWGARSWICAGSNFLPEAHIFLYETCVLQGDFARGRRIISAMLPLMRVLEQGGKFIQCVKHGVETTGLHDTLRNYAEVDLSLLCGNERCEVGETLHFLFNEVAVPVCSPAYLEAQGPFPDAGSLSRANLLHLHERHWTASAIGWRPLGWDEWFRAQGASWAKGPSSLASNKVSVLTDAALAGEGVMLGWHHMVLRHLEEGRQGVGARQFPEVPIDIAHEAAGGAVRRAFARVRGHATQTPTAPPCSMKARRRMCSAAQMSPGRRSPSGSRMMAPAVAQAADGSQGMARPFGDDAVALPLGLIALNWLRLYKPLVEAKLPQMARNIGATGLGFARDGGRGITPLSPLDLRVGSRFAGSAAEALHLALKNAAETIARMPATHMKYPGTGQPFEIDRGRLGRRPDRLLVVEDYLWRFGEIRVPLYLWRALSRYDAWIEPALIAEWQRLMQSYAEAQGRRLDPGAVARAMAWHQPLREVGYVRRIADRLLDEGGLQCVWTGKRLSKERLDIDHCMPWAAWPCDDLWNLLPADPG